MITLLEEKKYKFTKKRENYRRDGHFYIHGYDKKFSNFIDVHIFTVGLIIKSNLFYVFLSKV